MTVIRLETGTIPVVVAAVGQHAPEGRVLVLAFGNASELTLATDWTGLNPILRD